MKRLTPPDSHHLSAAVGWLELGNWQEANEELERIAPIMRAHPDVLEVRCEIYAAAKRWEECVELAEAIIELAPHKSFGWVRRSFALHELKRTNEAFDRLLPVCERFPDEWMIPYNLACYCTQLGRIGEAREWFKKAMAIEEHQVKRQGIDDPDLQPLWDSMSGTTWKREG